LSKAENPAESASARVTAWNRELFEEHADLMTTARTYTHVLADEQELDYATLVAG
jgi:hypothetical protein